MPTRGVNAAARASTGRATDTTDVTTKSPTTSVVVVTYERPSFVKQCLDCLARQSVAPLEVIVVDSSPYGATHRLVTSQYADVVYLPNYAGYGAIAEARQIGVQRARGEIVAFVDDDSYAADDWLERLLEHYDDVTIGAVGGRIVQEHDGVAPGDEPIGRLLPDGTLTGNFGRVVPGIVDVDHLPGANLSVRRTVLEEIGGVHGGYRGTSLREETDICLRIAAHGHRLVFASSARVDHVAAPHARGQRFDIRYDYWSQHNHLVLLVRNFGLRAPIVRHYLARSLRDAGRSLRQRFSACDPSLPASSATSIGRHLLAGVARFGVVLVATPVGLVRGLAAGAQDRRAPRLSPRGQPQAHPPRDADPAEMSALHPAASGHAEGVRVALVPSAFWPSVGGVEELTRELATVLASRGIAVEVWTSSASAHGRPERDRIDTIPVRRFDFPMPVARPLPLLRLPLARRRALASLEAACSEFRPDILHVICFGPNGAFATALARRRKIGLVVTLQGETVMDDHDIYERSTALRWALRRGLATAEVVTACSRFTLDDARRFGLRDSTSEVVFNATSLDEVAPDPPAIPFARYVLCLGRVVRKKGFDLLVDAFARMLPDHPDLGLVVAGGGRELDALRDQVRQLGIEPAVHFTGMLGRAAVAGAMQRAALFVMPSRVEPFGIVALEAWRAGVPVVVSSRGGAPEFVRDGIDGLVADPVDSAELAAAMSRILDDRELAARLAASGLARVSDFTWDRIATTYERCYKRCLLGNAAPAGRARDA